MGSWSDSLGGRAVDFFPTLGTSEIDRATGNKIGINKAIDSGVDAVVKYNPLARPNDRQVDPNAVVTTPANVDPRAVIAANYGPAGANTVNTGTSDQLRAYQMSLLQQLQGQASGTGPSVVQNQLRENNAANIAAAHAAAVSGRGGANPLLQRAAANNVAQINAKAGVDSENARLQEQMTAMQALGTVAGQARTQDMDLAKTNAQLAQQFDDNRVKYLQLGLNAQEANQRAALDVERLKADILTGNVNRATAADSAQRGAINDLLNTGGSAIMTGMPSLKASSTTTSGGSTGTSGVANDDEDGLGSNFGVEGPSQ